MVDGGNPWLRLPAHAPYVLPSDAATIAAQCNGANVRDGIIPKPFSGGLDNAKVVILAKAPLYNPRDEDVDMNDPAFLTAARENLADPYGSDFYYFRDGFEKYSGYDWWEECLRPLTREGVTRDDLRRKVMVIDYFPYACAGEPPLGSIVKSQQYGLELARDAARRKLVIVIMAPKAAWLKAVPEIKDTLYLTLVNPRNTVLGPGNFESPLYYKALVAALKS